MVRVDNQTWRQRYSPCSSPTRKSLSPPESVASGGFPLSWGRARVGRWMDSPNQAAAETSPGAGNVSTGRRQGSAAQIAARDRFAGAYGGKGGLIDARDEYLRSVGYTGPVIINV